MSLKSLFQTHSSGCEHRSAINLLFSNLLLVRGGQSVGEMTGYSRDHHEDYSNYKEPLLNSKNSKIAGLKNLSSFKQEDILRLS